MYKNFKALAALLAVLLALFAAAGAEGMRSGQTYYTDLRDMVTNVSITGAEIDGNTWTVRPDTPYGMSVLFKETGSKQFDMDEPSFSFTYRLPDGIVFGDAVQTGNGQFKYMLGGETYKLEYSYTVSPSGESGEVTITPDYDKFKRDYGEQILTALKQTTNVSLKIDFSGKFGQENKHLEWGNGVTTDVVVDLEEKHDLQITKSAEYDPETGYVNYTLSVTSEGNNRDIVVKDTITGNALTFDSTQGISIIGEDSSRCTPLQDAGGATFGYAIDSMTDGQVIHFNYRAKINYDADGDRDGQLTYDQTHNTASVTGDGTDEKHVNWGNNIQFSSVSKGNGQVVGVDGQKQTVSWTVEVNKERIISVGGTTLTDSIVVEGGSLPMNYSGDGITVTVYDTVGGVPVQVIPVSWRELDIDPSKDTSYTYQFPKTDEIYYYVITYTTEVDVSSLTGDGTVKNTAEGEHGHGTGSAGITGHDEGKPKLTKNAIDYNIEEVTWQVVIHVPAEGLTSEYSLLTDNLPSAYNRYFDEYVVNSIEVSGLYKGEPDDDTDDDRYTVEYGPHSFNIQFKKADGTDGLTGIGAAYDVYVTFKTKNNEDWISAAASDDYLKKHINYVHLSGMPAVNAVVTITSPTVNKYMDKYLNEYNEYILEAGGVRYVSYNIVVGPLMSGETSVNIRDEFDTGIFRVPTESELAEAGILNQQFTIQRGTQDSQVGESYGTALYNNTGYGIEIVIPDTPYDPLKPYLKVHYYLALRDNVDLDQLAANSEGQKWITKNTAIWNDVSGEATFEHDYVCLDKELLNPTVIGGEQRIAKYRITFNPAQGRVNEGEDIILEDTWSETLNIDYSSISITTVPESANANVSYTISGYTATYTIPDQTKVIIEYNALVLGTRPVEFKNEAWAEKWRDETKETRTFDTSSEGTALGVYFPVLKVDGNNNRIRIPGVKFKLTAPENHSLKRNEELYEVILSTNENGVLLIDQSKYVLYFYNADGAGKPNLTYTLTEMEPAAGYSAVDVVYTISFAEFADQVTFGDGQYIYPASGGSIQIKNKPLEGLTVRKKTVNGESGKTFNFTITLGDESINGNYGKTDDPNHAITFRNGTAEFSLKDGEYKQAFGLPAGIGYTIQETAEDGYSTVSTGRTAGGETFATGDTTFTGTTQNEGTEITFVNSKVFPASITFQAIKVLTGRKMIGGEFVFAVYENGKVIQVVTNDADGVVSFETIPYTEPGEHTYIVKEVVPKNVTADHPTVDGFTYDLTSYTIKVEVVNNGDGTLSAGIVSITENK